MAIYDGLISWWTLDEKSGTRVDSHGSNDLADEQTVLYGVGKKGNAADFEVTQSECLWIADNADLSFGDEDFTLAAWVKTESRPGNMSIISKYDAASDFREYQFYYEVASNRFRWLVSPAGDGGGSESVIANNLGVLSDSIWYFIVAWHDATANKIYIMGNNGVADETSYGSGCNDNASRFVIGASDAGASFGNYMDGLIDEPAVWGRILTAGERTELWNAGAGRGYGYWRSGNQVIWIM